MFFPKTTSCISENLHDTTKNKVTIWNALNIYYKNKVTIKIHWILKKCTLLRLSPKYKFNHLGWKLYIKYMHNAKPHNSVLCEDWENKRIMANQTIHVLELFAFLMIKFHLHSINHSYRKCNRVLQKLQSSNSSNWSNFSNKRDYTIFIQTIWMSKNCNSLHWDFYNFLDNKYQVICAKLSIT